MKLLEREQHLEALRATLNAAKDGHGCLALVYGEAGMGKTSLVNIFIALQHDKARVLWGACDALFAPRPLGPLHDIARQLGADFEGLLDSESNRLAICSRLPRRTSAR